MMKRILPFLLILAFLAVPVSAITMTAEGVSSYSMVADEGMVIYQITVNDLPLGTNQTHTLNVGSSAYLLEIETYKELGFNNAEITLTTPNGSVQTYHTSALGILTSNYKTNIQYVYPQSYSGSTYFTISLVIGLTPEATASFNAGATGWNPANSLAFTAASGNLGGQTTVYIEEMSAKDFEENVVNYNPLYGLSNLGSQVFQWTWDRILGFISMIPIVGPTMVILIGTMGGIISTGVYWLVFVVSNFPAVLCGVECIILMMAVINAPGKNSFKKLASNIYKYNGAFVLGIIGLVEMVWSWTRTFVEMIATIVQALKPI